MSFKRQIFGFMDLLRYTKMVPKRRKALEEGSSKPLPKSYRVNETARILHPGYQSARVVAVKEEAEGMKTLVFETERPLYFRAGQYVTLSAQVGESFVSRPYAISSAPALPAGMGEKTEYDDFFVDPYDAIAWGVSAVVVIAAAAGAAIAVAIKKKRAARGADADDGGES